MDSYVCYETMLNDQIGLGSITATLILWFVASKTDSITSFSEYVEQDTVYLKDRTQRKSDANISLSVCNIHNSFGNVR